VSALHRALAALLGLPDAAALPARIVAFAAVYPDDALTLARDVYRGSVARRLGASKRSVRMPGMLAALNGDPLAQRAIEMQHAAMYGPPWPRSAVRGTTERVRRHLREPVALPVASEAAP